MDNQNSLGFKLGISLFLLAQCAQFCYDSLSYTSVVLNIFL